MELAPAVIIFNGSNLKSFSAVYVFTFFIHFENHIKSLCRDAAKLSFFSSSEKLLSLTENNPGGI